ncbi:MAG: hypothetical protein Q8K72_19115 [Acidimicrobiales bacterium]|nr:hypothetical protein [Acidimicrobiales bacterium]
MSSLATGGVSIDLPAGWDGQIRAAGQSANQHAARAAGVDGAPAEGLVVHAASFPLPSERGDYGSGAVEQMGGSDVLVCLLEHERAAAATALFAHQGVPRLEPSMFSPQTMQRALPGMAGTQHFFQVAGRPFCLYVVVGSWRTRGPLVTAADRVATSIRVTP